MMKDVYPELKTIYRLFYKLDVQMSAYDVCEVHDELEKAIEHLDAAIVLLQETTDEYEREKNE